MTLDKLEIYEEQYGYLEERLAGETKKQRKEKKASESNCKYKEYKINELNSFLELSNEFEGRCVSMEDGAVYSQEKHLYANFNKADFVKTVKEKWLIPIGQNGRKRLPRKCWAFRRLFWIIFGFLVGVGL